MPLILIADDDRDLVHLLEQALAQYATINASDGESILHQVATAKPDLVLLDLGLPDVDGGILLSRIRKTSKVPIIILSGRHEQADKVLSLQAGADDFISKPFDIDDLEARVEVVLRRSRRVAKDPVLNVGTLNISSTRGQSVSGNPFDLTPTEHKLLMVLAGRPKQVVTRKELAEIVWGWVPEGFEHLVTVNVTRLRTRLRRMRGAPDLITIRRKGYVLRARGRSSE